MNIHKTSFQNLNDLQKHKLLSMGEICENIVNEKTGVPIYYISNNQVHLISDYVLINVKAFESEKLENLYRGGGVMIIRLKDCDVVIPDDRYQWLRPVGGIAKPNEAINLEETAIRESIIEELGIYSRDGSIRYIPNGAKISHKDVRNIHNYWNFTPKEVEYVGHITKEFILNFDNQTFEAVLYWHIPLNARDLIVLHQEDWFTGGASGITPLAIDDNNRVIGVFSGRQGYFPLPFTRIHPTVAARTKRKID